METDIFPDELVALDEIFLTSSIRGVMPVSQVEQIKYPVIGPVTQKVMRAYKKAAEKEISRFLSR